MTSWEQPTDYLRWELDQIRDAQQEARRLLATCPPGHRDTYRASLERWDARERAKEEQIAEAMAQPTPTQATNELARTATIPRSLAEVERQGALGRLFDAENRRQQIYGWAY